MQEKIAVIVPAKASPREIDKCIGSLLNLGYPDLEVILVDDGLEKDALHLLGNFKDKIKVIKSDSRGPSAARNLAAKNTAAEYIAFTDSDCIVDRDWLKELIHGFRDYPQAVSCGGVQGLPQDATNFEKKVFLFMQKSGFISDYVRMTKNIRIREVNHNPSCNVMYKKEVYLKEGGFLEGLWPGEDVEFDYRLKKKGYKLFLNPKAVVYHYKPKNWKSFLRMMYRYGFTQGFLVKRYGIFRKIHLVPVLSMLCLVLLTPLLFSNKIFVFCFIVGAILSIWFYFFDFLSFLIFLSGISFWHLGFIAGLIKNIF